MKKPDHIPEWMFERMVRRFMKNVREVDEVYRNCKLRTLERDQIIEVILSTIAAYVECRAFGGIFTKQLKTYFLEKYLHPFYMTKVEIGAFMGYKKQENKSTHLHSMTIHNCQVIENYLFTKDRRYYEDILTIDEKLQTILK